MNWRFADFLVELSDPASAEAFQRDPEAVMDAAGLTGSDRLALRTGKYGVIRFQAAFGDVSPIAPGAIHTDRSEFVHVEINHQSETSHDLIARHDGTIKRRFGPHTTFHQPIV